MDGEKRKRRLSAPREELFQRFSIKATADLRKQFDSLSPSNQQ